MTNGGNTPSIQEFGSSGNFEEDVLKAHNDYRALHGVPPLELSKDLCNYALEWAKVGILLVIIKLLTTFVFISASKKYSLINVIQSYKS